MQTAREVYATAQDMLMESWHRAQLGWEGMTLTTWEHIGIGVVCALLVFALIWMLVKNCPKPAHPLVIEPPQPNKETKGMAPKAVTMGKKQKQLLVRVMEAGFYELRKQDMERVKNKVRGPKPITNSQARSLYRNVGYAFDIPCILPVTTMTKLKAQIRTRTRKLKESAIPNIPGQKPKATVEPNNLPVIKTPKEGNAKAQAMSF